MSKNINASIPDEIHEALAAEAAAEDRTLGAHVGRILRQHVEARPAVGKATTGYDEAASF